MLCTAPTDHRIYPPWSACPSSPSPPPDLPTSLLGTFYPLLQNLCAFIAAAANTSPEFVCDLKSSAASPHTLFLPCLKSALSLLP
ncbi:unnamed protein product [Dibothriocephalus latus]|uniref:Uncharacterized protein n=1 Tax=Dibothriocephalus latus TaxID=60516 RepID=A0A3P6R1C5_DIBLA|nr:unnamed protein product [Dibothriocephalus latus]